MGEGQTDRRPEMWDQVLGHLLQPRFHSFAYSFCVHFLRKKHSQGSLHPYRDRDAQRRPAAVTRAGSPDCRTHRDTRDCTLVQRHRHLHAHAGSHGHRAQSHLTHLRMAACLCVCLSGTHTHAHLRHPQYPKGTHIYTLHPAATHPPTVPTPPSPRPPNSAGTHSCVTHILGTQA